MRYMSMILVRVAQLTVQEYKGSAKTTAAAAAAAAGSDDGDRRQGYYH
eukprot:COSAG05_NODE_4069_length_1688_cov_5.717432_1_plen_48_part_00